MDTTVYADVLFLVNFLINLIILKITCLFMKEKPLTSRLCISSAVGAAYAVFMFFPKLSFLYIIPFKIAFSVIMIKIICPMAKMIKMFKYTVLFYMVSFTFAGVLLSLIYLGGLQNETAPIIKSGIFYFDISLSKLLCAWGICYAVIALGTAVFKRNKSLGIKQLKICLSGRICEIDALCDTGNLLRDPFNNSPVIIAEKRHLLKLFPDGIPDIDSEDSGGLKLRLIPYSSLGNKGGMMIGFIPDEITIDGKSAKSSVVAISPGTLSAPGEYGALFNPDILTLQEE